jgi:hypothetical protein
MTTARKIALPISRWPRSFRWQPSRASTAPAPPSTRDSVDEQCARTLCHVARRAIEYEQVRRLPETPVRIRQLVTGVLMNGRMLGFVLDPASPNCVAPGKRPVHASNTFLVQQDGRSVLVGGRPNAHWQVQTNLQVLTRVLDWGMDVDAAVVASRFTLGDQLAMGAMRGTRLLTVATMRRYPAHLWALQASFARFCQHWRR